MPYIKQADRVRLDPLIQQLAGQIKTEGDANYVFTRILTEAPAFTPLRYSSLNAAGGVLWAVGMELYRRLASPYEDSKRVQNGDIPVYLASWTSSTIETSEDTGC